MQGFDFRQNGRYVLEELHGLIDGHVEYVGYRFPLEAHFKRFAVVAFTVAHLARYHHVGQEVHFDGFVAVATAGLAPATFHVERETPRLVATYLSFGQVDKEAADIAEDARVGGRIASRRAADGALVYVDHLIYIVHALDPVIGHRLLERTVEMLRENRL